MMMDYDGLSALGQAWRCVTLMHATASQDEDGVYGEKSKKKKIGCGKKKKKKKGEGKKYCRRKMYTTADGRFIWLLLNGLCARFWGVKNLKKSGGPM